MKLSDQLAAEMDKLEGDLTKKYGQEMASIFITEIGNIDMPTDLLIAAKSGELSQVARDQFPDDPEYALLTRVFSAHLASDGLKEAILLARKHGVNVPERVYAAARLSRLALQHAMANIETILVHDKSAVVN